MYKNNNKQKGVLFLSAISLATGIGLSSFIINNSISTESKAVKGSTDPVAYINDPINQYISVEKALEHAVSGDVVVLIPPDDYETAPLINETYEYNTKVDYTKYNTEKVVYEIPSNLDNVTIKEGVTLVLPYDITSANEATNDISSYIEEMKHGYLEKNGTDGESLIKMKRSDGSVYDYFNFHTNLAKSKEGIFLRTKLVVGDNTTIINNGTIVVAGDLSGGNGGSVYNGQTSYYYSEICLGKGSQIINASASSKIYSFGYITEQEQNNGSQILNSSGTIYLPFILRDYRGVTSSMAIYDNSMNETYEIPPFNQIDFKNIETTVVTSAEGSIIGLANIHDNLRIIIDVSEEVNLVGGSSDYFIYLNNSKSKLVTKYNKNSEVLKADFYDGFEITKVELNVSEMGVSMDLSTENVYFPISYRFDISLNSTNNEETIFDSSNQDLKLLPGATLRINENCVLNVDKIINYSALSDRRYPAGIGTITAGGTIYDNSKIGGRLEVAGKINANSIAGDVILVNEGELNYSSDELTSYEFLSLEGSYTTSKRVVIKERLQKTNYEDTLSKKPLYIGINNYDTLSNLQPGFRFTSTDPQYENLTISDGFQRVLWLENNTEYKIELLEDIYTIYEKGNTNNQLERDTLYSVNNLNLINVITSSLDISSNNSGINEFDVQSANITSLSYPIPTYAEETYIVFKGRTINLSMDYSDADKAYDKTIQWSSLDSKIATVSTAGVVTGIAEGETLISSTIGDKTDSFSVVVTDQSASEMEGFIPLTSDLVSIKPPNASLDSSGGTQKFSITIEGEPWINTITWDSGNANITETTTGTRYAYHTYEVEYLFPKKSGTLPDNHTISCTIVDYAGNSVKLESDVTVGCFEKGTLITTNRGLIKVEDLQKDDLILSYNHFVGRFEYQPINIVINHGLGVYQVMNLYFDDGSKITFIGEHGLFNLSRNQYSSFTIDNYEQFIGEKFVKVEDGVIKPITLTYVTVDRKITESYTCLSRYNLNCITNDLLSVSSDLHGLYNIFKYNDNLMYDSLDVKESIEKYGLFEASEFKDVLEEKYFDYYNVKYLKISIGKGLMTYQDIMRYIEEELYGLINSGEAPIH